MKWYDRTMLIATVAGAMFAGLALFGVRELHPFFEFFNTAVSLGVTLLLGVVAFWTSAQFSRRLVLHVSVRRGKANYIVDLCQVRKVTELKDQILKAGFSPDVIIGIARGGLLVAAMLSKQFEEQLLRTIPVILSIVQGNVSGAVKNPVNENPGRLAATKSHADKTPLQGAHSRCCGQSEANRVK